MPRRWHFGALGLSVVIVACRGETRQEEAARHFEAGAAELERAANGASANAGDMAKGLEAMAKGLTAMAGGDANAKPIPPAGFRDLMAVFPESLAGWERSKPTGERMTMPVNFSEAQVRFRKDESSLTLKVTDSGLNQLLIAPFSMFRTAGYEKETERGYEKSMAVSGFPDDPKVMHELAAATNLKGLASLKSDDQ